MVDLALWGLNLGKWELRKRKERRDFEEFCWVEDEDFLLWSDIDDIDIEGVCELG